MKEEIKITPYFRKDETITSENPYFIGTRYENLKFPSNSP